MTRPSPPPATPGTVLAPTAGAERASGVPEPARWARIRREAVEQVMRVCDDDLAVLPFQGARPGSAAAAAALGRFLTEHPQHLLAGCPLIALVTDTEPTCGWRGAYPAKEHSLHSQLEFLASLYGLPDSAGDPYEAFRMLTAVAEQALADPEQTPGL